MTEVEEDRERGGEKDDVSGLDDQRWTNGGIWTFWGYEKCMECGGDQVEL